MISRIPRSAPLPASLPPAGLDGLDPSFSRLVTAPESEGLSVTHQWHILDNGPRLAELGVTPVGTILCVHGNPTWSYLWRSLVSQATDAAADGREAWRVIAVDQLDMGFSERTGVSRTLPRRVRDLGDLTDALQLRGPVITLGHDWGGVVSLGWAVDHPEILAGVAVLNTAIHQPEGEAIPAPLRLALLRGVLGAATVATPAFLETTLALAHPPLAESVKDAYRAPYLEAARRGGIGGFVADIPVDDQHDSYPELARIAEALRYLAVPALALWGPRDPIFSDRYLDDLVDRLPHADVHRFEGAGHLVAEDVDYAASVLTWLGDRGTDLGALGTAAGNPSRFVTVPDVAEKDDDEDLDPNRFDEGYVKPAKQGPPAGLFRYLDELRDSSDTALVEMAPAGSKTPTVVTWRLLSKRVRQIAAGLTMVGVKRGDRVSLLVQPGADLTAVLYACLRIGAVVVVADAGLGVQGLTRAVRGAWPDHVIGAPAGLAAATALGWPGQKISTARYIKPVRRSLDVAYSLGDLVSLGVEEELPELPGPEDVAAVLFTSGSTGPAKGVVYTHGQLAALVDALSTAYGVGPGTGLVAGFAPFALLGPALGARSVTPDMVVTSPKTLTATAVAAAVAAVDATVVFLSPAAVTNVVATSGALDDADRAALAGVKDFLSAGAPVSERLLAAASGLMPNATAHTPYGMTEGLLMTDITLEGIRDAALTLGGPGGVCVGLPAASVRVRISALDENGDATGELSDEAGVTGEIVVSAPHVKDHYDGLWITERESRRGAPAGERWHRTGDVGHLDDQGRLWVEGRMPHVIVTADGVVTPVGPEQRFESVFEVARAALVGIGPRGEQQLVAVIETVPPAFGVSLATSALASAVRSAVDLPIAAVLVVPHLPTDIRHNSKIDRVRLGEWASTVFTGGRMTRP
ncbi:acyl-CoA synthetase (AMP-forming)/AMP-acid ligase II/pimeloyl-ACP methyl ester carboxylesterase [Conyzicola lurida]|uniref:Acyl-CoA synthetase (AMP-forming)/AMP-acid ligase II/pimeloyl-ACP methyl ester carboxylesterase n=1 Tax=Conyzicola lurida TaxID=1172621 RepID=A0A841AS78_9MICO|nr:acyl-CoA synthetase (AMP-forming)/AMP-acid ligase II/pimeloyl-ACP methyl ester carboxylesterase [Conyzicola lurida]